MTNTANYGWSKEALTGEVASFPTRLGSVLDSIDTSLATALASKMSYALPTNVQTGTTYTAVLADANKLTTLNNASPIAVTIPPQSSVAWLGNTVLRYTSLGAGVVTFAGGAGVTVTNTAGTLAQYQSADLIRTGSDAWTVLPFAGGSAKATVSGTTGSPTITTVSGKTLYKFTGSGSITMTAGLADVLIVAGGGGGQVGGGGGGQVLYKTAMWFPGATHTVTVGGAGNNSAVGPYNAAFGGTGGYSNSDGQNGGNGGGGGARDGYASPAGIGIFGYYGGAGGGNTSSGKGGGGGGAGGAGAAASSNGGSGGSGYTSTITGSSVTFAGGGGGGVQSGTGGSGGSGGGGTGATNNGSATAGAANTGSGGGGAWSAGGQLGGSGTVFILIG